MTLALNIYFIVCNVRTLATHTLHYTNQHYAINALTLSFTYIQSALRTTNAHSHNSLLWQISFARPVFALAEEEEAVAGFLRKSMYASLSPFPFKRRADGQRERTEGADVRNLFTLNGNHYCSRSEEPFRFSVDGKYCRAEPSTAESEALMDYGKSL
jgi:hypothetical protein